MFEEFFYSSFIQERCTQNPEDFKGRSSQFELIFNDSNQTISSDCSIDLYSNSILRNTPKRSDMQMLFNPFEKQFNLPSVFIKKSDLRGLYFKIVRKICKGSPMLFTIKNNTTKSARKFVFGLWPGQSYDLIKKILSEPSRSSSPWMISY